MELISVNVGVARTVEWNGKAVRTAIFKAPVAGAVAVHRLGVAGDEQANLEVHGGPEKAVYAYPAEHYPSWAEDLGDVDLPWGALGENLTLRGAGLLETEIRIGDRLRIGGVELRVTQPRTPCYKLGIRLGTQEVIERMIETGRCGFYFAVEREGEIEAGRPVEVIDRSPDGLTVAEAFSLRTGRGQSAREG